MSRSRSAATTTAKSARPEGLQVLTSRVSVDELAALDAVRHWAKETLGRDVSRSEAVRIALRLAAATVSGNADLLADLAVESNDAAAAQQAPTIRLSDADREAVLAGLAATESAYRKFDGQVQRLGNNVNQLTLLGHVGEVVDEQAIAAVQRTLNAILTEMRLWERFDNRERMRLLYGGRQAVLSED